MAAATTLASPLNLVAGSPTGCAWVRGMVNPTYRSSLPLASAPQPHDCGSTNPSHMNSMPFRSSPACNATSPRTCVRMVPQPSRSKGWAMLAQGLSDDPSVTCLRRHFNNTNKAHVAPASPPRKTSLLPQELPLSSGQPRMPVRRKRPEAQIAARGSPESNPLEAPAEIGSRRAMPYNWGVDHVISESEVPPPLFEAPHRRSEGAGSCVSPAQSKSPRVAHRSWSPPSQRNGLVDELRQRNQGSHAVASLIQGVDPLVERASSAEPRPSRRKSPRQTEKREMIGLDKGLNRSSSNECLLNPLDTMQKRKFSPRLQSRRAPWEQLQDTTPRALRIGLASPDRNRSLSPRAPYAIDESSTSVPSKQHDGAHSEGTCLRSPGRSLEVPYATDVDIARDHHRSITVNPPKDHLAVTMASIMQSKGTRESVSSTYVDDVPPTCKSPPTPARGSPPMLTRGSFGYRRSSLGNDIAPLQIAQKNNGGRTPRASRPLSPRIAVASRNGYRTPRIAPRPSSPRIAGASTDDCRTPILAPRHPSPRTARGSSENKVTNRGSPKPVKVNEDAMERIYAEKIKKLGSEIDQLLARHAGLETRIKLAHCTQQAIQDKESHATREIVDRGRIESVHSGAP